MNALDYAITLVRCANELEDALLDRNPDDIVRDRLANVTTALSQITLAIARERPGVL